MMERLLKTELLKLTIDDKDKLEDVIIDNKQAIEMANIYSNILSGMMDAFADGQYLRNECRVALSTPTPCFLYYNRKFPYFVIARCFDIYKKQVVLKRHNNGLQGTSGHGGFPKFSLLN